MPTTRPSGPDPLAAPGQWLLTGIGLVTLVLIGYQLLRTPGALEVLTGFLAVFVLLIVLAFGTLRGNSLVLNAVSWGQSGGMPVPDIVFGPTVPEDSD